MKVEFKLSIGLNNCIQTEIVEFHDAEFIDMNPVEIDEYINQEWQLWCWNYIDGSYKIIDK